MPTEKKAPAKKILIEKISLDMSAHIVAPVYKEDKNLGIISYGKDNLYPEFLMDLFINISPKHSSIIKRKVNMATGNGFTPVTSPELAKFVENSRGSHPLADIAKLIDTDYEILNAFALFVSWNEDKTFISSIDYLPAKKVRKGIAKNTFQVSDDWKNSKKPEANTKTYQKISRDLPPEEANEEEKAKYFNQIVYFTDLSATTEAYAFPYYQAGINYIVADGEIGKYTLNNIANSFVGGYHVAFTGAIPEPAERRKMKKQFLAEYTGSASSNVVFTFNETEGNTTKLTPLPTNGEADAFLNVESQIEQNLFILHNVTNPQLFGVRVPGSLGGKDELLESLEIMKVTTIEPRQIDIENVFNRLAKINEIQEELKLEEYKLFKPEENATSSPS